MDSTGNLSKPLSRPPRGRSLDCMARIVSAFLICGQLSRQEMELKAGVGNSTAARAAKALLLEGLIEVVPDTDYSRKIIYRWKGK